MDDEPSATSAPSDRSIFSGSGPGARTADGCSVDLYRRLTYQGEFDDAPVTFVAGTRVLDLGCGTGRLTRWFLERGCIVTAVDSSTEMLAEVPHPADTVRAEIERLTLSDRVFDCVVLSSGLINHPHAATRRAFVQTARRHLIPGGVVLVQSQNPQWLATADVGPAGESDRLSTFVEAVQRSGADVSMTLRYTFGADIWRQSFTVVALDDAAIEDMFATAGFRTISWFGPGRRWVAAAAV